MIGGAHVEIVDMGAREGAALVPTKLFINGVDVGLVAKDGVRVDVGGTDKITEVTITLFPSRVTIRGVEALEPQ